VYSITKLTSFILIHRPIGGEVKQSYFVHPCVCILFTGCCHYLLLNSGNDMSQKNAKKSYNRTKKVDLLCYVLVETCVASELYYCSDVLLVLSFCSFLVSL